MGENFLGCGVALADEASERTPYMAIGQIRLALLVCCGLMAPAVLAQDAQRAREEAERLVDQAPQQRGASRPSDIGFKGEMPKLPELGIKRPLLWDLGGWARGTYSTYDTPFDTDRTLRDLDVRIWGEITAYDNHRLYARARTFFADYNSGDSPRGKDSDWQMFRVDQLFYEGDLARAFKFDPTIDLSVTAGRQFFLLGKGAGLLNLLDGVRVDGRYAAHGGGLFGAQIGRAHV